jgi:hypothetical protein
VPFYFISVREQVRCFFPYKAQNEDELNLNEGDIVTIISKGCEDEGWWRGELRGKIGLFPDNFVKTIPPNEVANQISRPSVPTVQTTKMSPQGRNLTGVKPIVPAGRILKSCQGINSWNLLFLCCIYKLFCSF